MTTASSLVVQPLRGVSNSIQQHINGTEKYFRLYIESVKFVYLKILKLLGVRTHA